MIQKIFSVLYQGEGSYSLLHWAVEVNVSSLIRQRKQIMKMHTFEFASQKVGYFRRVARYAFSPGMII